MEAFHERYIIERLISENGPRGQTATMARTENGALVKFNEGV